MTSFKFGKGLDETTLLAEHLGQECSGLRRKSGLRANCGVVLGDRLVELTLFFENYAEVIVHPRQVWLQTQRNLKLYDASSRQPCPARAPPSPLWALT